MTDKLELQTQPIGSESEAEATKSAFDKLKNLVEHDQEEEASREKRRERRQNRKQHTESGASLGLDNDYDQDGFKLPEGKVPLDGHFTTKEVERLVQAAQQEGMLDGQVEVDVVQTNSNFGDKIVIKDSPDELETAKHAANVEKEKKRHEAEEQHSGPTEI